MLFYLGTANQKEKEKTQNKKRNKIKEKSIL